MNIADLHMHTLFSDALDSPARLVEKVYNTERLKYFALTDHDSLSGIEPLFRAKSEIEARGTKKRHFIPGVEISCVQPETNLSVHILGFFPMINDRNYRKCLASIDEVLGEHCTQRCNSRVIPDVEARLRRAFELDLDGIASRWASPEKAIGFVKEKAACMNARLFEIQGKNDDIIKHPIPVTYQIIIDCWPELTGSPLPSKEKASLYILRPDGKRRQRLKELYLAEGNLPGEAEESALRNQGCMLVPAASSIREKGTIEALELLKKAGATTFLAHPAVFHKKITYDEFDRRVLIPLIRNGLHGIEVYYPYDETYRHEATVRYMEIAEKNGLLISGGSDYHGDGRSRLGGVDFFERGAKRIIERSY